MDIVRKYLQDVDDVMLREVDYKTFLFRMCERQKQKLREQAIIGEEVNGSG